MEKKEGGFMTLRELIREEKRREEMRSAVYFNFFQSIHGFDVFQLWYIHTILKFVLFAQSQ